MNFFKTSFVLIATLITNIQLSGMLREPKQTSMEFTIQTEKLNIGFRPIDLRDLANPIDEHAFSSGKPSGPSDRDLLIKHFGDFDANANWLGMWPAAFFQIIHAISPSELLELYVRKYAQRYQAMPEDQKILQFWIMEDLDTFGHPFVGKLSVSTYVDDCPEEYEGVLLLEVGLSLSEEYRNKGITSQLAQKVYQHLQTLKPFEHGIFCFDTRTENIPTHRIAKKAGAQLIHSREKEVDFLLFKQIISYDLFIIPKEEKPECFMSVTSISSTHGCWSFKATF